VSLKRFKKTPSVRKAASTKVAVKKGPPFEFVLETLESITPSTRPMFGCHAVYHGDRIVLILRRREAHPGDNGIWVATTRDHHPSLKREFPSLRSIALFGEENETSWQNLPEESPSFEEDALRLCELVMAGDPRIGKTPKRRSPKKKVSKPRRARKR
jgi:hypothetical protein